MKHNRLLFLFSVSTVLSVVLRTLQLYYSVDAATGFFKKENTPEAQYILLIIFLCAIALFLFSLKSHRAPISPPENSVVLSCVCILAAFSICYELFSHSAFSGVPSWQVFGLTVSALLTAVFLLFLASFEILGTNLPPVLSVFPTTYLVFKLICEFTSLSALALISDTLFLLLALACAMLFMLNLTKLFTKTAKENGFRQLLGWGLCASCLCISQSLPHFLILIFTGKNLSHIPVSTNLNLLFLGFFILNFVLVHFGRKNTDKII